MNMDNKRDMELSQYIFPIYSGGTIVGQGFVADGYFVTAAHVVKDFPECFVVLNGKRFDLAKEGTAFRFCVNLGGNSSPISCRQISSWL